MKRFIALTALALCVFSAAFAQNSENKVIRRIQIRKADPQLIWLLLQGRTTFNTPPELSTIQNISGFGNGGFGGSGFGGSSGGGFGGSGGGFGSGFGGGGNRGGQGGG